MKADLRRSLFRLVLALVLIGGGMAGVQAFNPFGGDDTLSTSAIPTGRVARGEFVKTVASIGQLQAAKSSIIASFFDGKVVRILDEGTRVSEGDPVIWLDTEQFAQDLKDEESRLALAIKDLEAAEDELRLQEIQNQYDLESEQARVELAEQRQQDVEQKYETERTLVEKKISPQSRLDEAYLAMLQAAVELRNARINLKKTEENLASRLRVRRTGIEKAQLEVDRINRRIEELNDRLDKAVLRAPADGEVSYFKIWKSGTSAKIAEGDSVWPRLNLVEIPDRSQMLALAPVNELDISLIESGHRVRVSMDALPGENFTGVVERKSIVPIDRSQSRTGGSEGSGPREFEVRIRLGEQDDRFFQGMTASVAIEVNRIDDAIMVPIEALTMKDGAVGVYVVDGGFVSTNVLDVNDLVAAVDAEGLADGQSVYLRSPSVPLGEARVLAESALREVRTSLDARRNAQKSSGKEGEGAKDESTERRRPGGRLAEGGDAS